MKQLLEYIIPNIVNHPEEVKIEETNQDGLVNVTIQTHPEDVGRVIGKSGKVIKSIRQIARIIAIKQGVRVNIDVLDSGDKPVNTPEETASDLNQEDEITTSDIPETQPEEETASTQESTPEEGIDLQTE
jgi:predicted RNA-binding protein YlqC (UPF0109 family)